jgi:hypothetical protein
MRLTIEGVNYEITNWDEFKEKLLSAIGFQVVPEIRRLVKEMKLIGTSDFWQSIDSEVVNG